MKRFLIAACAVLAASQPVLAQNPPPSGAMAAPASQPAPVLTHRLSNGLTVFIKPDHRAPTAVQMLWLRVGSMDEVDGTTGVAHALEHMMFKGTPSLAPGEFSRRVAALGGRENAFTGRDYTGYYQQIPATALEEVMRLESDRFARNQWADDEFRKEIEVVKEERRLRTEDNPRALMWEHLSAQAYLASPYRRPVVGWMSDLDAMRPDDVRDFHRRWYRPANAALVVAGDVDPARVIELARKYYGSIEPRPAEPGSGADGLPVRKPREEPRQQGLRRFEFKAPAEQALVALAFKVPKLESLDASNDAFALTVLAAVLDGYPGARLDKALTQGPDRVADRAGAYSGLVGRGPQIFVLDGVPAQGRSTEELERALREQVARVAREGVTEVELNRVKTQWISSQVYKLDSVFNQARELGSYWVQGLPTDTGDRIIARLRQVSADQVKDVAARYFGDDELTVGVLRPQPIDRTRRARTPPPGLRH